MELLVRSCLSPAAAARSPPRHLPPHPTNPNPIHSGFGFVTFATKEEAQAAIDALNETELDGRTIRVNFAQPRDPNAPRPQRRGTCVTRVCVCTVGRTDRRYGVMFWRALVWFFVSRFFSTPPRIYHSLPPSTRPDTQASAGAAAGTVGAGVAVAATARAVGTAAAPPLRALKKKPRGDLGHVSGSLSGAVRAGL